MGRKCGDVEDRNRKGDGSLFLTDSEGSRGCRARYYGHRRKQHSDEEVLLLEQGSMQRNLWGINLYPERTISEWIEFDSMIMCALPDETVLDTSSVRRSATPCWT